MTRYQVRFFWDANGSPCSGKIIGLFEIGAESETMALVCAKRRFSLREGIADWSVNANRYDVTVVDRREASAERFLAIA